jgi:hypothetical protein
MRLRTVIAVGLLAAGAGALAQPPVRPSAAPPAPTPGLEQPDAQRTRDDLSRILQRCPPSLRSVLALDPTLLANQSYLAPYPALANFLNAHPEIAHNPSYYVGDGMFPRYRQQDPANQAAELSRDILGGLAAFASVGLAIGLLVWLVRTLIDYRRWSRLAKVQTDVHAKLLDRFTANDDLLAYIQSPAGSSFLQSTPIKLDAGPRTVAAPLGRILWSVQAGLVLAAAGIGLEVVGGRVPNEAGQPLHALGVFAIALGLGFVVSAIISYVISRRLGLIEMPGQSPVPRS